MFLVKKILGALLQPVPLILLLLIPGLVLLWMKRREHVARWLLTTGTLLLLVLSIKLVPYALGRALEGTYDAYRPGPGAQTPEYIVVLGGGSMDDPDLPPSARLSPHAMMRLVEAVRISRMHPEARLVLSGGTVYAGTPEAEVMAEVARFMGIHPERMILESASRDTHDQAQVMRRIVEEAPFVLVTSAVHMPRSMALFRKAQMDPVPAPTGHLYERRYVHGPQSILPTAEQLRNMEFILHELLGLAWAWLRGQV